LLFPNFASAQGVVVAVTAAGCEPIWLPAFGQARLMELQRGGLDAPELGGWLKAYALRNSEHLSWRRTIDRVAAELWQVLWTPVLARLAELGVGPGAELVWFPQGGSGVFPLHAAWRDEGRERRWLLDDYTLRYAPSIAALLTSAPAVASGGTPVQVVNPTRDLPFSELECAWVRRHLDQNVRGLHGEEATAAAVLRTLGDCDVLHCSSHAMFDLNRPLQSFMCMAAGEHLSIEQLLPVVRQRPPRLVALSACETAMARTTVTPDEFLGFPAALLHAGTATVLATLWPVDDGASALLVGRFFQEWRGEKVSPALALRRAQNWLRRVSVRELLELLRGLKDEPAPVGPLAARCRTLLRGQPPEYCPCAEPWFWAAFTISGKE
jgi:CHAT domain-containing protein